MNACLAAVFVCSAVLLGCGPAFAPAVSVETASPSPFRGQQRFVMLPIHQSSGAVPTYFDVGNGRPVEVQKYIGAPSVEAAFSSTLVARAAELGIKIELADDAPADTYVIRPVIETLDATPGHQWRDVQTRRPLMTGVQFRIDVTAPDGRKDEFLVTERRLGISTDKGAQLCAESAVEYLRKRVTGER